METGTNFFKPTKYNPMNINYKFAVNKFMKNVFIAFLLKNCWSGGFTDHTLCKPNNGMFWGAIFRQFFTGEISVKKAKINLFLYQS